MRTSVAENPSKKRDTGAFQRSIVVFSRLGRLSVVHKPETEENCLKILRFSPVANILLCMGEG